MSSSSALTFQASTYSPYVHPPRLQTPNAPKKATTVQPANQVLTPIDMACLKAHPLSPRMLSFENVAGGEENSSGVEDYYSLGLEDILNLLK